MNPNVYTVDNLQGAYLISVLILTTTYGISVSQTWFFPFPSLVYANTFNRYRYFDSRTIQDRWPLKLVVASLAVIDFIQTLLMTISAYKHFVKDIGQPFDSFDYTHLDKLTFTIQSIMVFIPQGFFAYRIFRLNDGNLVIPLIIITFACGQLAGNMAFEIKDGMSDELTLKLMVVVVVCNMACDLTIAATIIYFLKKGRSGLKSTTRVLNQIILYTLNTCLLTSILSILTLSLVIYSPKTAICVPSYLLILKLYVISMLSTLNKREKIRMQMAESDPISLGDLSSNLRDSRQSPPDKSGIVFANFSSSRQSERSADMTADAERTPHIGFVIPEAEKGFS